MRTRILFQAENVPDDLLSDVRVQLAQVPLSGGSDFSAVDQESASEFPHEVVKRQGPLLRFQQLPEQTPYHKELEDPCE
jgi:hypothetical protein